MKMQYYSEQQVLDILIFLTPPILPTARCLQCWRVSVWPIVMFSLAFGYSFSLHGARVTTGHLECAFCQDLFVIIFLLLNHMLFLHTVLFLQKGRQKPISEREGWICIYCMCLGTGMLRGVIIGYMAFHLQCHGV